jgi:hypothetical protein
LVSDVRNFFLTFNGIGQDVSPDRTKMRHYPIFSEIEIKQSPSVELF